MRFVLPTLPNHKKGAEWAAVPRLGHRRGPAAREAQLRAVDAVAHVVGRGVDEEGLRRRLRDVVQRLLRVLELLAREHVAAVGAAPRLAHGAGVPRKSSGKASQGPQLRRESYLKIKAKIKHLQ